MTHELPARPAVRVYGTLALILLVALLPLGGAWVLLQGDGWSKLSGLLLALVVVLALGLLLGGVFAVRRGRVHVRTSGRGTELPSSAAMLVCLLGLGSSVVLFGVSFLAGALASGGRGSLSALLVVVVALVLAVPIGVGLARGRFQRGGLLLTPETVGQSSYNATSTIAWDQLAEVALVADPGRRMVLRARNADGVRRSGGAGSLGERSVGAPTVSAHEVSVPLAFMGSDGAAVARAIDFYQRTPSARAELGTDAARERLEQGRLDQGA